MKLSKYLSILLLIGATVPFVNAQTSTIFFDFDTSAGKNKVTIDGADYITDLESSLETSGSTTNTISIGTLDVVFTMASGDIALGSSGLYEATSGFDNGESLTVQFNNADVTVTNLDWSALSGTGDTFTFSYGGTAGAFDDGGDTDWNTFDPTEDTNISSGVLTAGQNFSFTFTSDADAYLENMTFTVASSAVPEPSTYALIFGALTLGFVVYRKHKKSA